MSNKNVIITCYYAVMLLVLGASVIRAVVVGGAHVNFGREVMIRQSAKQELLDEKTNLERQLATATSITVLNDLLLQEEYVTLTSALSITTESDLALRY